MLSSCTSYTITPCVACQHVVYCGLLSLALNSLRWGTPASTWAHIPHTSPQGEQALHVWAGGQNEEECQTAMQLLPAVHLRLSAQCTQVCIPTNTGMCDPDLCALTGICEQSMGCGAGQGWFSSKGKGALERPHRHVRDPSQCCRVVVVAICT
jgi:hypothetical protein